MYYNLLEGHVTTAFLCIICPDSFLPFSYSFCYSFLYLPFLFHGFTDDDPTVDVTAPASSSSSIHLNSNGGGAGCVEDTCAVRLMAVRVIAEAIKHMPVLSLLDELPSIVTAITPSMTSSVVDVRKAVIVVLVNSFFVIGDALYPFVEHLPPSQKKLLNIYIDKQLQKL